MRNTTLATAIAAGLGLMSFNVMADYSTTVGGKIFADMSHISTQKNGKDIEPTGTGIDVKRFYLTLDHDFTDIWSANLTTDFTFGSFSSSSSSTCSTNAVTSTGAPATCTATTTTATAGTTNQVYVKKAYVQAAFMPEATVRLGSTDMPWIGNVESNGYAFRYVEKTLIDRVGFGNSADWGLHFLGKASDGMFNYALSTVNGAGYKNFTRSKTMDFEGRINFQPLKGLNFALGGYSGKLGQDTVSNEQAGHVYRTANRADAMASFIQPLYSVGAEWFKADNFDKTSLIKSNPTDSANGYSVWGSVVPMDRITVFARYDLVNPNKDTDSAKENKYYNLGAQYDARKNVKLAMVYKHETTEDNNPVNDVKYDEIGVFTEVKF